MFKIKLKLIYFMSAVVARLKGEMIESRKILKEYKNKFQGKRCFIIGNGPSLTAKDLEKLKGEITFAANRIYKIFDETNWRPTFWAVFDEAVGTSEGFLENINRYPCEMKFFRQEGYYANKNFNGPKCLIHSWWDRKYLNEPQFSCNLEKGVFTIATVTYTMIQIARYMGFTEIYLLGLDHKYQKTMTKEGEVVVDSSVKSYFGENSNMETNVCSATWELDVVYEYAEKYSKENNFRIYNVTRGGALEIFERKNFDEVITGIDKEKEERKSQHLFL